MSLLVTLSGIDGTGKTSVAYKIFEILTCVGVRVRYRHEYEYLLIKYLFKLFGNQRVEKARSIVLDRTNKERKPLWSKIWPFLVFLDQLLMWIYYKIFFPKSVVILDRYAFDQLVSFQNLGLLTKITRWLLEHFPSGDLSIILIADPIICKERKKHTHNYSLQFYQSSIEEYMRIARKRNLPLIDSTSVSVEEVSKEILGLALKRPKFKDLLYKVMLANRTLYQCALGKGLDPSGRAKSLFNSRMNRLLKTLKYIERTYSQLNVKYLIIKTFYNDYYLPTYDVDLFMPRGNLAHVVDIMKKEAVYYDLDSEENKVFIAFRGHFPISIHTEISWDGETYISSDFMWDRRCITSVKDTNIPVPCPAADFLLRVAHIAFEIFLLRRSDFECLEKTWKSLSNSEKEACMREAQTQGWGTSFKEIIKWLQKVSKNCEWPHCRGFPVWLPIRLFLLAHLELLIKRGSSWKRFFLYIHRLSRYALWRVGAKLIQRPPFGEIVDDRILWPWDLDAAGRENGPCS